MSLQPSPESISEGRAWPVARHYLPRDSDRLDLNVVIHTVLTALAQYSGDVLVFLPGGGEIRQVQRRLEAEQRQDPRCQDKHLCKDMATCEEARFYLTTCGLKRLDHDSDGVPCESLCH